MKRCPVCQGSFPDDANFCPMDAGALEPIVESPPAPAAPHAAVITPPQAAVITPPRAAAPRAPAPVMVSPQAPLVQKLAGPQAKATPSPKPARKGKFRETMWFKKGELDEQAAAVAASSAQQGDAMVSDKADELPMEDRYGDDGSLSTSDKDRLSLRTGSTQMMQAVRTPQVSSAHMSEDELARELRVGQGKKIALIVGAIIFAIGGIFAYNMLTKSAEENSSSERAPKDGAKPAETKKTE